MVGRGKPTDTKAAALSSAVQKVERREQRQDERTGRTGQRVDTPGRTVHDGLRENA